MAKTSSFVEHAFCPAKKWVKFILLSTSNLETYLQSVASSMFFETLLLVIGKSWDNIGDGLKDEMGTNSGHHYVRLVLFPYFRCDLTTLRY